LRDLGDGHLPGGIEPVKGVRGDEDILHINHTNTGDIPRSRLPWVRSVHSDLLDQGLPRDRVKPNFIFVSRTMAHLHQSDRYVLNGLDPADFIYSESKGNYFLFVISGGISKARKKGLDIAFRVANQSGILLLVAGGSGQPKEMAAFDDLCRANNAVFVGTIQGERKAVLFTTAKALLFPTQINEAFGLPVAEALMSGTAVIASNKGAMSEMLGPGGGFVCADESGYMDAVANIGRIKPAECRRLALERFHYLAMARGYVREYEREIGRASGGEPSH
jgi:glycosyltransferase involved in cell wall biosynthesis